MAGTIKVDSINADSNLTLKIANTAVAFIDATGLRPTSGNVNLDATATSKLYLPSANTVAIQTAGVTAVTVDSSQNVTLAGTLTTTGITNSGVATGARFNPTGSSATGNGMYLPAANSLGLSTNGTNAVYIDSSQNVGISSTPSAWGAGYPTLQVGGGAACLTGRTGTSVMYLGSNWYYDGTNNKYIISDSATQYYQSNGNHVWRYAAGGTAGATISATEAMRIVSSGELVVGGTTAGGVGTSIAAPDSGGIYCNTATTGLRNQIRFVNPNGTVGSIQTNGSATAYNTSSDYRLKENITPMTGALAKVAQLKPVTYKWKVDGADGEGFIAHELAEVCSHAVSGEKDAIDENGNPQYQGIDVSFLVATLTAAIKELKAINDTQAETINALTANLTALTARITALESTP